MLDPEVDQCVEGRDRDGAQRHDNPPLRHELAALQEKRARANGKQNDEGCDPTPERQRKRRHLADRRPRHHRIRGPG